MTREEAEALAEEHGVTVEEVLSRDAIAKAQIRSGSRPFFWQEGDGRLMRAAHNEEIREATPHESAKVSIGLAKNREQDEAIDREFGLDDEGGGVQ